MTDVFTKKKRSEVMSRIRAKNTKPEMIVRKYLFANGFRYRIHQKRIPGNPDIVLKKYNTLIFIHGCFWHGHLSTRCKIARMPKSNTSFWKNKIANNQIRDLKNKRFLKRDGWNLITVWECNLQSDKKYRTLKSIVDKILNESGI